MKKRLQIFVWAVAILPAILISSCVNLRAVNAFSSASLVGITGFEDLNYSFAQHCMDRCAFDLARKPEIIRMLACDCDNYKKADTVALLIYTSILGYFDGLASISDDNLARYNLDALKTSLTEGSFGDIKINKEQVDAYAGLSQILLNATTGVYRRSKIKKYIEEANKPIRILLDKFQFILQKNLEDELNFKKERLYAYYRELLLNASLNEYEKNRAASEYYQQLSDINTRRQQIDIFATTLAAISEGHQQMYDNRNKISARDLAKLLAASQSDIRNMISQFNKLKM